MMAKLIIIGVIGSVLLGLAGCAAEQNGYYRSGGGFTDPFEQSHGGSR